MTLVVSTVIGVGVSSGPASALTLRNDSYVPVTPVRVGDTRTGAKPAAGSETKVKVAPIGDVPNNASAVWLNVTAVLPEAAGHLTVYPCGSQRPNTANVNYTAGSVSPNAVLAKVGTNGEVCVWTLAASHIVTDLNGYVPLEGSPTPIVPQRAEDTRSGAKPAAGSVTMVKVAGEFGVPSDVSAVMLNVTAVAPSAAGHLTVYPCGVERANTANVNYTTGSVSPNAVLSGVGSDGNVCIWTMAASHIVVDVMGFVPAGGTPTPIAPARDADTRSGAKPAAGSETKIKVAGVNGVPASASAAMLNVTAVLPDGPGHLTVYPCGVERPNTANVNYTTGSVSPNAVLTGIGTDGNVCVWTLAASHIVVDVMGFVPATRCTIQRVTIATVLSKSECEALVDLYNSLGGPTWDYAGAQPVATAWNTPVDPCTWSGVVCGSLNVVGLNLSNSGLAGAVPASIADLGGLNQLFVDDNAITSLPPEIGSLGQLQYLDAGQNKLSSVPAEVGSLSGLMYLGLDQNAITELPTEIGMLSNLEALYVGNNGLTELPTEIGDLGQLKLFSLSDNQVEMLPVEVGNLTSLQYMWAKNNQLSGDITPVFQPLKDNAPNFQSVSLAGNGCLTTTDAALAAWLDSVDSGDGGAWNGAC